MDVYAARVATLSRGRNDEHSKQVGYAVSDLF